MFSALNDINLLLALTSIAVIWLKATPNLCNNRLLLTSIFVKLLYPKNNSVKAVFTATSTLVIPVSAMFKYVKAILFATEKLPNSGFEFTAKLVKFVFKLTSNVVKPLSFPCKKVKAVLLLTSIVLIALLTKFNSNKAVWFETSKLVKLFPPTFISVNNGLLLKSKVAMLLFNTSNFSNNGLLLTSKEFKSVSESLVSLDAYNSLNFPLSDKSILVLKLL